MAAVLRFGLLLFLALVATAYTKTLPEPEKERIINDLDQMVDDDGSIEMALIDYLLAKQIAKRLHEQLDVTDLQRKRSYWKQCAFNAVSCFGK
ncbi:prohormone-1-like [Ischnura elegans]|uniref:prohormone-1-like n=1 Tax=Ischnura elegans TaxID=197161 RepID=UPI001ED892F9|nr:prohormone-1-like [Ischnura elegans]